MTDFDILERLGDGSFSTVVLARYKGDGQQYAVKIVNKTLVLRNKVCPGVRPLQNKSPPTPIPQPFAVQQALEQH